MNPGDHLLARFGLDPADFDLSLLLDDEHEEPHDHFVDPATDPDHLETDDGL